MPIPSLTADGFLPEGVHECSAEELHQRFGLFQQTDRRPKLFAQLQSYIVEAKASGLVRYLCIDGSFVTALPEPNDIDLILVVAPDHDLAVDLSPAQYNVVSRTRVRRLFGFDIVAAREGTSEVEESVSFFQEVRGRPDLRKGILRLLV